MRPHCARNPTSIKTQLRSSRIRVQSARAHKNPITSETKHSCRCCALTYTHSLKVRKFTTIQHTHTYTLIGALPECATIAQVSRTHHHRWAKWYILRLRFFVNTYQIITTTWWAITSQPHFTHRTVFSLVTQSLTETQVTIRRTWPQRHYKPHEWPCYRVATTRYMPKHIYIYWNGTEPWHKPLTRAVKSHTGTQRTWRDAIKKHIEKVSIEHPL